MDDLISRQAAIAEFSCCELTPDGGIDANYAIDFLEQLPSAQPERKKGKWHWMGFNIECSECGAMPNFDSTEPLYNFCPYCGADMREDNNDRKIQAQTDKR